MHDPKVIAFDIPRPWPQKHTTMRRNPPRWKIGISRFWYLNGSEFYWPPLVTVWHNEPGGHDSGTICHWRDSNWQRPPLVPANPPLAELQTLGIHPLRMVRRPIPQGRRRQPLT